MIPYTRLAVLLLVAGCSEYEVHGQKEVPEPPAEEPEPELEPPVAVAAAGGAVKRGESLRLDGRDSYDPDDPEAALSYVWRAEDPKLVDYELRDPETARPEFVSESLGIYTFELNVQDTDGLVSEIPAWAAVEVLPWEDLEVSLTWSSTGPDLDLHLVAPKGSYYTESDCFFGNPEPDWGVEGDVSDNPFLSEDDDFNGGPETIQMAQPAEDSYRLLVHYFNDHDIANPATELNVTVHAEGQEIGSTEQWLYEEGQVLDLGLVHWPTLEVEFSPTVTSHAALGGPPVNEQDSE